MLLRNSAQKEFACLWQSKWVGVRDCTIITWRGAGKWVKYAPKLSHTPPLIKQKLISTLPHKTIILRLTPPPLLLKIVSPPIDSLIPSYTCWISSSGTSITSNDSSTYVEESLEESSESLDSELVSSSHELGDSSSSTASLVLRFPRAWIRTQEFLSDWVFFFWS